jgi:hypothetical protein
MRLEGKKQYHVEVSNRFAALEELNAEVDINSAWESHGLTKYGQNYLVKGN